FKAGTVKEIIRTLLFEKLSGKSYDAERVKKWTVELANEISSKVTELKMKRYKHIVQVILGEHKGAGVKSGVRCVWDAETDGYTSEIFS
ncbi:tctex1 domain-containing protein 2, partial [Asbolus verrucosus]